MQVARICVCIRGCGLAARTVVWAAMCVCTASSGRGASNAEVSESDT